MNRVSVKDRILIVKLHAKLGILREVQRQFPDVSENQVLSLPTISAIVKKFDETGSVLDQHVGRSGRPKTARSDESVQQLADAFARSPKKSI